MTVYNTAKIKKKIKNKITQFTANYLDHKYSHTQVNAIFKSAYYICIYITKTIHVSLCHYLENDDLFSFHAPFKYSLDHVSPSDQLNTSF